MCIHCRQKKKNKLNYLFISVKCHKLNCAIRKDSNHHCPISFIQPKVTFLFGDSTQCRKHSCQQYKKRYLTITLQGGKKKNQANITVNKKICTELRLDHVAHVTRESGKSTFNAQTLAGGGGLRLSFISLLTSQTQQTSSWIHTFRPHNLPGPQAAPLQGIPSTHNGWHQQQREGNWLTCNSVNSK